MATIGVKGLINEHYLCTQANDENKMHENLIEPRAYREMTLIKQNTKISRSMIVTIKTVVVVVIVNMITGPSYEYSIRGSYARVECYRIARA